MKNSHVGQWFGSDLQCRRVLDRGGFDDNTIRCALAAHGEYGAHMCWPGSWPQGLGHTVLATRSWPGTWPGTWPGSWPGSWAGWVCGCPSTPFRTQPPPSIHLPQSWPTRLGPTTRVRRCNRIHAMHQHRSARLLLRNRALVASTRAHANMHLLSGQEPGAQPRCSQTRSRLAAPTPTDLMAISKRRRA